MRTLVMVAGAALALAPAALAGPGKPQQKPKPAATPTTIHCPVMTARVVNIKEATAQHRYADYKGNRYYFCCGMCPSAFNADPAKYAKGEHLPIPKPAGKTPTK